MEENYKLEKEYKVPAETFRDAYLEFQKKYVYPKSYIYMAIFGVLAVALLIFGIFAMHDAPKKQKYIMYLAFIAAAAFSLREWFNPRKMRRSLTESVRALGEPVYKIGVGNKFVDISTVSDDLSNIAETEEKDDGEENTDIPGEIDPLPEKTRINVDEGFQLMEYDRFFLMLAGKEMFYILPKEGFSEAELKIVRDIK
ncbi:YcxB family protein [Ruminococcus flavefaciens]|uniref:YcxB family protein n=1 Tax=Ruminococcus flavefaciens TaxID=1265 RepID=UPI0015686DBF|nr:YcxB family protein [Ruminococcus flavefaciens]